MVILGISAYYHDAAAALIQNGKIIAAAQEERFTRIKNDPEFPYNAIKFCLAHSGYSLNDVDAIVFYDKPFLKFERLLESFYSIAPKGWCFFLKSMPVWLKEKLFLKKGIRKALATIGKTNWKHTKLLFTSHHLSHAASAYFAAPYQDAAIVTIDGVGEWATATIMQATDNKITLLKQLNYPDSIGLFYAAITYYCGFKVNSGEYKLMGLAPYGNADSVQVNFFVQQIKKHLLTLFEDGSIQLHQQYFDYARGDKMVKDALWENLFGFAKRNNDMPITQMHCDFALAAQIVLEEIVIKIAWEAKRLTGAEHLCLAGGVALNCVANGRIEGLKIFKHIFIQPAAGDAGGAIGAALAAHFIYFGNPKKNVDADEMQGCLLGPSYSDTLIESALLKHKLVFKKYEDKDALYREVASLIAKGNVAGWFQGRMEFGPRALGARSILADPRIPSMQQQVNTKIKFREGFRPFAPAVLLEDAAQYFDLEFPSPYMMLVKKVNGITTVSTEEGKVFNHPFEKLSIPNGPIPAVTHVDGTARIQTVDGKANPGFYKLLQHFKSLTHCSVLLNTSFNVRGEPIVNTPEEALQCFLHTHMDSLAIGSFLVEKINLPADFQQPVFQNKFLSD